MSAELNQVERRPYECCNEPANLERTQIGPDRYKETCKVCARRHFVMEVDPVEVGVRGARI